MGLKILVTGGTGYIGSHTVVELIQAGYEPVIIDDLSNSTIAVLDGIEKISGVKPLFEQFDLQDKNLLTDFFSRHTDIAAVIHFAAFKAVGESVDKPLAYYQNNVGSLMNVMKVAGKNLKLVFSSSCTVYGQPDSLPVTESAPFKKAESPYGNTKQICEEILEFSSKAGELQVISLRYFNPVGAHPSALLGELPSGTPNNLVPFITQTAIGKRNSITVFGNDYDTPDGSCIRDYIHVVDLAKAHVLACARMLVPGNTAANEIFNLGTGRGYSVLEVIHTFEEVNQLKLNYSIGPRRTGDVVQIYGDAHKASSLLNWTAALGLEEMLRSAWEWERQLAKK